ncbi:MAG: hypothetical protein Q7J68_05750 [Thermoplasmata archaeon]|nr:hypothetical protein [Thermoplasmata archaeon]
MSELEELMAKAREASWRIHGKKIIFYHPGMFRYHDKWGRYSAISITGSSCELLCEHCKARLLKPMIDVSTPQKLIDTCLELEKQGDIGCLITGGFGKDGTLPWDDFLEAIKTVKESTGLHISVHGGIIGPDLACRMKEAGIDQALIDVVGDAETMKNVLHLDTGPEAIESTLKSLKHAGIPTAPHIVVGLDYGRITGEYEAIQMIKRHGPEALVIVSLMPLSGTPMCDIVPPSPEDIARIIATARLEMPDIPISLGCARDRRSPETDVLAVDCGVNRMAIPSDEAIKRAEYYGLTVEWQRTCCSVPFAIKEVKDDK